MHSQAGAWEREVSSNVIFTQENQMIKVSVNGKIKEIEENLNVKQLIEALEYKQKGFALAINTTFVSIKSYEETIIRDGDKIDILAPVQGG